jgi:hypothetical protein
MKLAQTPDPLITHEQVLKRDKARSVDDLARLYAAVDGYRLALEESREQAKSMTVSMSSFSPRSSDWEVLSVPQKPEAAMPSPHQPPRHVRSPYLGERVSSTPSPSRIDRRYSTASSESSVIDDEPMSDHENTMSRPKSILVKNGRRGPASPKTWGDGRQVRFSGVPQSPVSPRSPIKSPFGGPLHEVLVEDSQEDEITPIGFDKTFEMDLEHGIGIELPRFNSHRDSRDMTHGMAKTIESESYKDYESEENLPRYEPQHVELPPLSPYTPFTPMTPVFPKQMGGMPRPGRKTTRNSRGLLISIAQGQDDRGIVVDANELWGVSP